VELSGAHPQPCPQAGSQAGSRTPAGPGSQLKKIWAPLSSYDTLKLGKVRNSYKNIAFQIDHALVQGPPLPGQEPPMLPPH
jgi:hypothetical protein